MNSLMNSSCFFKGFTTNEPQSFTLISFWGCYISFLLIPFDGYYGNRGRHFEQMSSLSFKLITKSPSSEHTHAYLYKKPSLRKHCLQMMRVLKLFFSILYCIQTVYYWLCERSYLYHISTYTVTAGYGTTFDSIPIAIPSSIPFPRPRFLSVSATNILNQYQPKKHFNNNSIFPSCDKSF